MAITKPISHNTWPVGIKNNSAALNVPRLTTFADAEALRKSKPCPLSFKLKEAKAVQHPHKTLSVKYSSTQTSKAMHYLLRAEVANNREASA